jgi:hypothetical protein
MCLATDVIARHRCVACTVSKLRQGSCAVQRYERGGHINFREVDRDADEKSKAVPACNGTRRSGNCSLSLFLPAVLFIVLLGLEHAAADTIFVGRLAGAAVLAIGTASWVARADARTPAQLGLLTGILITTRPPQCSLHSQA